MGLKDKKMVPGTEVVFRATAGESASSRELVLIPRPTKDPHDPLNWSTAWKTTVIVNQSVFVFVSILTPLSIAPLTPIFEQEFNKSIPQVNLLFGAAAITLGYANFIIVPLANVFGRRPVITLCGLVCVLANIWQALVTSYGSFIGARVVSGLGAAANESIMPMVVADLLFVHQRGRSMALYFWAYFIGIFVGPIISGSIAATAGWRWFFWICAILQAASLLFIIVAHPETRFVRPSAVISQPTGQDERRQRNKASDVAKKGAKAATVTVTADTDADAKADGASCSGGSSNNSDRPSGQPSRAQFGMVAKRAGGNGGGLGRSIVQETVATARVFSLPIVVWASLTMGFAANCLLGLNLTEAQVFGAGPYGFGSAQIGYTNLAFAAGAMVALVTAGPLGDGIALRRAQRNGGVLEAEMRLLSVVPYVAACVVGMVVAAVGYQRGWPWEAVVVVGYGLVGVEVVAIPAVVISYAVDSYKSLPGEIMIAATVVKNTFGFGMVFFFNDWAARQGYISPVLTLMAVTVGLSIVGLAIFIPYGKRFREATKDSSLHTL